MPMLRGCRLNLIYGADHRQFGPLPELRLASGPVAATDRPPCGDDTCHSSNLRRRQDFPKPHRTGCLRSESVGGRRRVIDELCMGLRPTHRDENRVEPRAFTIDLAWNGEDRGNSGLVEADDEFGLGCVFEPICVAPSILLGWIGST
jgi:hypothetical protein